MIDFNHFRPSRYVQQAISVVQYFCKTATFISTLVFLTLSVYLYASLSVSDVLTFDISVVGETNQ